MFLSRDFSVQELYGRFHHLLVTQDKEKGILFPTETLGVAMDAPISSLHKHAEGH